MSSLHPTLHLTCTRPQTQACALKDHAVTEVSDSNKRGHPYTTERYIC